MPIPGTLFETELAVRPDDIDMHHHVHATRYLDYLLAARYDQMARCYKMSMPDFHQLGLTWFFRTAHIDFKRPLKLGDRMTVQTRVDSFTTDTVRISFAIRRLPDRKTSSEGWADYTLVDLQSGRAVPIPEHIQTRYSI